MNKAGWEKGISPAHQQQVVLAAISNRSATHGSSVRGILARFALGSKIFYEHQ